MRVVLALSCLGLLLAGAGPALSMLTLLLVLLAAYSVAALYWKRIDELANRLLSLMLDTVLFLVCIAHDEHANFWVGAFFAFYLLLSASLMHGFREVLVVGAVCASFLVVLGPSLAGPLLPLILLLGLFACVLSLHKQALLDRLSHSSRQVVLFRAEAENARESERQRIAADFHDGPLQSFISFQMRLEILRKMIERDVEAGVSELKQLQDLCRTQVAELRSFVRSMRPMESGGAGMVGSILRLIQVFQKESGIPVRIVGGDAPELEDLPASTEVLQIVREALHNVQKHSNASRVTVAIARHEAMLSLSIDDDGRGFPFSGSYTIDELDLLRLGPASIKRRVRSLSGDLVLDSKPGCGAMLRLRIPL